MSKGRSGTTGSGLLGGGVKKPNQEMLMLKNEVEELRLEKEQSRNNLIHFISELDEANRRTKELEEQLQKLQSTQAQGESVEEPKTTTDEPVNGLESSHDACKSELSEIQDQLLKANQYNEKLKSDAEQLKVEIEEKKQLEEHINRVNQDKASMKSKIEELEKRIQTTAEEHKAGSDHLLREQKDVFEAATEEKKKELSELKRKLQEASNALEKCQAEIHEKSSHVDRANQENTDLKTQLEEAKGM
jgi:chromosome segregation ATPase